jgi:Tol biopolymer transport system component
VAAGFPIHWHETFGRFARSPASSISENYKNGQRCRINLQTRKVVPIFADLDGAVRDPCVHYDAKKILFSYRKAESRYFHLYEINVHGTGLRQLTDGPFDDIEPTYMPDGGIVFVSSRAERDCG